MVQLDPILLDSHLVVAFGFGLAAFYLFLVHYMYPFFFQTLVGAKLVLVPEIPESNFDPQIAYSPVILFYPSEHFLAKNPFSEQFSTNYCSVVPLLFIEKFFYSIYTLRLEFFSYCVDQFFLYFETGLEHFDLYCRVNQSLLRFKHRIFY